MTNTIFPIDLYLYYINPGYHELVRNKLVALACNDGKACDFTLPLTAPKHMFKLADNC